MAVEQKSSKIIISSFIIISIISFTSIIFPRFLIELSINDPFRTADYFGVIGKLTYGLIVVNFIFFSMLILYKKNKLPLKFMSIFQKISNIEISRRTAFIIIGVLLIIHLIFSIDEFYLEEYELADYRLVKPAVSNINLEDGRDYKQYLVRFSLLSISDNLFGNLRILPYIASISLLMITYFLTLELTKSRFSGIVAFSVLLQSNLFLLFDTTATYENFWTMFYFLSVYLILKKPIGSPVSFILGLLSKTLTAAFLPINWYIIATSKMSNSNRKFLLITYGFITLSILIILFTTNIFSINPEFHLDKFTFGLNEFGNSLRFDNIILLLFFPATIFLILQFSKTQNKINVNIVLIGIIFTIISQPLLLAIMGFSIQPYRFIPFIVFTSIAIGMAFMNPKRVD